MLAETSPQGQHSSTDPRCQSCDRQADQAARRGRDYQVVSRYGSEALREGYTAIPNMLLKHYRQLGLSTGELVCVQELCSFWWDERLPHPAVSTLAARMGKCVRQVQSYLGGLQRRGLLEILPRQGAGGERLTNAYDLRLLFAALAKIDEEGRPFFPHTAPVQPAAPATPQEAAPKEDAPVTKTQLDLDSIRAQGGAESGLWHVTTLPLSKAQSGGTKTRAEPTAHANQASDGPEVAADLLAMVAAADTSTTTGSEGSGVDARSTPACGTKPVDDTADSGGYLASQLAVLSRRFADAAPRSTAARVQRVVVAAHLPAVDIADLLAQAATRTAERLEVGCKVRASMPYLLATFEGLLRAQTREPVPARLLPSPNAHTGTQVHENGRHLPERPSPMSLAIEPPGDAPPLWRAVLIELTGSLSESVMRQLLVLPVVQRAGVLRIHPPNSFAGQWLERATRRHIERALEDLGYAEIGVIIEVADTCVSPSHSAGEELRSAG